jgi:hypothetical protein
MSALILIHIGIAAATLRLPVAVSNSSVLPCAQEQSAPILSGDIACVEDSLGKSRPSSQARAPNGEEKKNQLDLFRDWAVELGKRAAAAAVAGKDAAAKHFEALRASFDQRSAKFCGILVTALVGSAYKEPQSLATLILALAVALSVLLTAVPLLVSKTPRLADRAFRVSNHLATFVLIVGVTSFVAAMLGHWLPVGPPRPDAPRHVTTPKVDPLSTSATPDEKSLTEEAERQSAALAEKEAARVADCLSKENAITAVRRTFRWRERELAKCKTEYATAFTLKSLDVYCGAERGRVDAAARALDAAVANMCSSTGSTK